MSQVSRQIVFAHFLSSLSSRSRVSAQSKLCSPPRELFATGCPLKRNKCEASFTQTDRDTPIRGSILSETNITPVLLITYYPCKLTVLYFLYYIPCTRARFDKNELDESGSRTVGGGEVDRRKSDTTFFFAPTPFLDHPFARDQRFRRSFLLQLSFW